MTTHDSTRVKPDPRVLQIEPAKLRETPENWKIYRRPCDTDQEWIELCESVAKDGVTTPLDVSFDLSIISGHRRLLAALKVGLLVVPCIVDPCIVMASLSEGDRVTLLVSRNKGIRIKTDSESYLEAAAAVDPEAAIREAEARKAQTFTKVKVGNIGEVKSTGTIRRTDPNGARAELLKAVLDILNEKRKSGYLPTSARSIHYQLLRKKVRTSSHKNGYIYGTAGKESDSLLSKLLTDARSEGLIDHDDIDDGTRVTSQYELSGSVGDYVNSAIDRLFGAYFSDVHRDQVNHFEILVEKNTIFHLLQKHVAGKFRLPITSLHGYGSFPAARDVAGRFDASGKDKLVILYISDLDPEGVNMPSSWKKYLKHDFDVEATVYRAAVTPEQAAKYNLLPDTQVKQASTRAPDFVQAYGNDCWEVDSMPESVLIDEVTKLLRSLMDTEALTRAFADERDIDVKLARMTAAVRRFVTKQFRNELAA
jgi:ParB-like nuclease family protein